MEAYKCLYRDPRSPLTPLAPMDTNVFNFQVTPNRFTKSSNTLRPHSASKSLVAPRVSTCQPTAVTSYKSRNLEVPTATCAQRSTASETAQKVVYQRSEVRYQNGQIVSASKTTLVKQVYKADNVIGKYHLSPQVIKRNTSSLSNQMPVEKHFTKPHSPFSQKPISPIIEKILIQYKLQQYIPLFARQEIDYQVLLSLTEDDLYEIGIEHQDERDLLLSIIDYYQNLE